MESNLSDEVSERIRKKIVRDLDPSPLVVHAKIAFGVIIGGMISLAICGQFGMGFTSWAALFSHTIHVTMPPLVCAVICGAVYAVFPTLFLRVFLCSPIQFRVILKTRFFSLMTWYGGAGVSLAIYGQHGQGIYEILFWLIAAIATSYLLALFLRTLIPRWDPFHAMRLSV